ncbi:MAG: DNA/RNA nuclease SfsA [Bdellovibrionales bacterium]
MHFGQPLIKGKMVKRYKRFFADVELEGTLVTAHCPNTGSLKTCWQEGKVAYLSESKNPDRKLKYTLELTESPTGVLVGVNTAWPNKLVKEAFESKKISDWSAYDKIEMEVKISKETRLDACLVKKNGSKCYIEVKNVTLWDQGVALFPDAETTRGQKHLKELMLLKEQGHEAEIIFVIQRGDCHSFSPAVDFDPVYSLLLKQAFEQGVRIRPLKVQVSPIGLEVTGESLPLLWPT